MKTIKKLLSMLLIAAMIIGYVPTMDLTVNAATNEFAGGSGTEEDPYLISTVDHLNRVRYHLDADFKMINDISFTTSDWNNNYWNSGDFWLPIEVFTGNFDGNGYTISGLKIKREYYEEKVGNTRRYYDDFGLFGEVTGNISNLTMKDVDITVSNSKTYTSSGNFSTSLRVGAIASMTSGVIDNCKASGKITLSATSDMTSGTAGGIVGVVAVANSKPGSVSNCINEVEITANYTYKDSSATAGGITGALSGKSIVNCTNNAKISVQSKDAPLAAGIVGDVSSYLSTEGSGLIQGCYNFGTIESYCTETSTSSAPYARSGGIVGWLTYQKNMAQDCGNFGSVSSTGLNAVAGGIVCTVSTQGGQIRSCFNTGSITVADTNSSHSGYHEAGGITSSGDIIDQCFNSGSVNGYGSDYVKAAGIATYSGSTISNCYNTGNITSEESYFKSRPAGIVSDCTSLVESCYNIGLINGTEAGAIASSIYSEGSIVDCYYLNTMSTGVYTNSNGNAVEAIMCSDTSMKQQTTFDGFDFSNTWMINSIGYQYPQLKNNRHISPEQDDVCSRVGHITLEHLAKEATCVESGWNAYETCYLCDYSTYTEIPALGHDSAEWKAIEEPTCTESGLEVYACTRCEKPSSYNRVLCDAATYPESSHNYGNNLKKTYEFSYPNAKQLVLKFSSKTEFENNWDFLYLYDGDGNEIGKYSGISLQSKEFTIEGSSFSIKITSDSSGVRYGFKLDSIYAEMYDMADYREIDALGHRYDENAKYDEEKHWFECECGDKTEEALHEMKTVEAKTPTCTEVGWEEYKECTGCGLNTRVEIEALGHKLDEWAIIEEPTCLEKGLEAKKCSACGKVMHEVILCDASTYPESSHNYENSLNKTYEFSYPGARQLKIKFSDKTETERNYDKIYLYDSNGNLVGQYTGTELKNVEKILSGDSFSIRLKTDSSMNKYGFSFESIYAEIANEEDLRQVDIVAHKYEWVIDQEPTEDETGLKHEKCKVCEHTRSENTVIDKLPHTHNMKKTEAKEATCEEEGNIEYYTCTKEVCGKYYADKDGLAEITLEETVIPALGHSHANEWSTSETEHWYECACGDKKDVAAHDFEWIIDKAATEDETGLKHEKCKVCEYTRSENTVIDKLPHTHNMKKTDAKEATCEEEGNIEYYICTKEVCGKYYADKDGMTEITLEETVIPALGHLHANEWSTSETEHWYECACGDKKDTAAHDFEWIIDKAATEDETGLKHEKCKVCEYTRSENTVIDKLPHTHDMKKTDAKDSSCTEEGNTEYYTCTKCNKLYKDEAGMIEVSIADTVLPVTGHKWSETHSYDATNHWYECIICKEQKDKAAHIGGTATGNVQAVCKECKASYGSLASGMPFIDVRTGDWFYNSVEYVYYKGLMTGMTTDTFGPAVNLSRAQFAVILWRANGAPEMEYKATFPDVPSGTWYTDAVLWANEQGIITGYSHNGHFGSADNITREQMALMMYRYANSKGYDTGEKADFGRFKDASKVSGFAIDGMQWAVGKSIITGKENGTAIDPQGNASRAECATIIMRFMKAYEE